MTKEQLKTWLFVVYTIGFSDGVTDYSNVKEEDDKIFETISDFILSTIESKDSIVQKETNIKSEDKTQFYRLFDGNLEAIGRELLGKVANSQDAIDIAVKELSERTSRVLRGNSAWYFEATYNSDLFLEKYKEALFFDIVKCSLSEEDIEEMGLEE